MDIKHLIISLSGERENFVKNQLSSFGFDAEIVRAISGQELKSSREFDGVPDNYKLDSDSKSWNHFACHLSWIKALQYAKSRKYERFVVYEDDCLTNPNYSILLQKVIDELPDKWVFVNLGVRELVNLTILPDKEYLAKITARVTGAQSILFNGPEIDRVLYQLLSWKNWVEILSPRLTFPKFATYPALTSQSSILSSNIRN